MVGTRQHRREGTKRNRSGAERVASLGPRERPRIGWVERFGLRPLGQGLRDARKAVVGRGATPATTWDLSSLKIPILQLRKR